MWNAARWALSSTSCWRAGWNTGLLAAQALAESLTLVNADDRVLAYPITSMDART